MSSCPYIAAVNSHNSGSEDLSTDHETSVHEGHTWTPLLPGDESDDDIIRRLGLPNIALTKHALFFADRTTGDLTIDSINGAFKALGLPFNKVSAFFLKTIFGIEGCKNLRDITSLLHSPSSKMFYHEGENIGQFNEEVFNEKCAKYATNGLFTHEGLELMIQDDYAEGAQELPKGITHIFDHMKYWINSIPAKNEMSTLERITTHGEGITVEDMKAVHVSSSVFRRIAEQVMQQQQQAA